MYTAFHAPEGESYHQSGFSTEELAWDYVKEQCMNCNCGEKPCEARMCEWFVMPTDEFLTSEGFEDILKASGFKEIVKENS